MLTNCDNVFIADSNGIVGFAAAGSGRDNNSYDSELYAIYVLQQHQRKNIGRLLLVEILQYLQTSGYDSMYVWVLRNSKFKRFYERFHGVQFDEKVIEIGGENHVENAYGWKDLPKLQERLKK